MMMKMLQAGGLEVMTDRLREADEDNPKGYFEYERVKDLDKNEDKLWVADARGKVLKVISQLLKDLPSDFFYQVIFMNRDLREVIASQNKMLVRRGEATDGEADKQLGRLFEQHLWISRKWLARQFNMEVLHVDYSAVLADPAGEAKKVVDFLDLPPETASRMALVVDPELYRNRASALAASSTQSLR